MSALVLITSLAVVLGATRSADAADRGCAAGVFTTRVVAIGGRRLAPLLGQPVSALRMWAHEGDVQRAIPFQVDTCGADGRPLVPALGEDPGDRPLGEHSLLLFVASDAGDRRNGPLPADVAEVQITSDAGGSRWAYLGRGSAPVAPRDDVDYDPRSDTVRGQRYTVRFHTGYIDFFSVADAAGRSTPNLVDRWKIRVEARILWGLLRFRRTEEDVHEEVIGYTDGPIRVIRRSRLQTKVGMGLSSPEGIADEYFYGDHYGGPSEIRIPFQLARVFGDVDVRIYLDSPEAHGFRVSAEDHDAAAVGGSVADGTQRAGVPRVSWFMLTRADVGVLHRLRLGPTLDAVESELFYVDDEARADPPEAVVGLRPGVGYRLTNWGSVERGVHEIRTETYVIDPAEFSPPDAALSRLSSPVRVAVRSGSPRRDGRADMGAGPPRHERPSGSAPALARQSRKGR